MAQPRQKTTTTTAGSKKTGPIGKAGGSTPASEAPPAWRGIFDLNRWRSALVNRPAASTPGGGDTAQRKPRSGRFSFLIGLLIFLVGIQVIQTLLIVVANQLHLVPFMGSTLAPPRRNIFLLSGMRWFDLIYLTLVAVFYFLLLRYNIIPRDPFGARSRALAARTPRTAATTSTVNVTPKTRADRRFAASVAAAKTTTKTTTKTTAQPSSAKMTTKATPAKTTASAKTPAKAGQTGAKGKAAPAASVSYDAEYARVKAAQRVQRRRTTKR